MINRIQIPGAIKIKVKCPVCKSEKLLEIPKSIISQTEDLTGIFIEKGMVCDHRFQGYIDKNFIIRKYLVVDLEYD